MESILEKLMKERGLCRLSGTEANKLTKESLRTALFYLMSKKPFEQISVTELVKKSGVSRQSFYRNYKSKEELLTEMGEAFLTAVSEFMRDSKYKGNPYQWYLDLFLFLKKNADKIMLLVQVKIHQNSGLSFIPTLHEILHPSCQQERYRILAYEGALNAIIYEWITRGLKEEAEYMAGICEKLFSEITCSNSDGGAV